MNESNWSDCLTALVDQLDCRMSDFDDHFACDERSAHERRGSTTRCQPQRRYDG
jgi:hypothetical protein